MSISCQDNQLIMFYNIFYYFVIFWKYHVILDPINITNIAVGESSNICKAIRENIISNVKKIVVKFAFYKHWFETVRNFAQIIKQFLIKIVKESLRLCTTKNSFCRSQLSIYFKYEKSSKKKGLSRSSKFNLFFFCRIFYCWRQISLQSVSSGSETEIDTR